MNKTYYCTLRNKTVGRYEWCRQYRTTLGGDWGILDGHPLRMCCAKCDCAMEYKPADTTPTPAPNTPSSTSPGQTTDDDDGQDGGVLRGRGVE